MGKQKRHTAEQIIAKVREADVELGRSVPVGPICRELEISERRTCRVLRQHRSSRRRARLVPDDEAVLTARVVALASEYGRYGYRGMAALLQREGWRVIHKRVESIWRQEGLKVPKRQPKRGRSWLNDGSCIRRRPEHRNHIWSCDFVADRTHDGRPIRTMTGLHRESRGLRVPRGPRQRFARQTRTAASNRPLHLPTIGHACLPRCCRFGSIEPLPSSTPLRN